MTQQIQLLTDAKWWSIKGDTSTIPTLISSALFACYIKCIS